MDRINPFWGSGETKRADRSDETVINGAPYDGHQVTQRGTENPAPLVDRPDPQITEEIKRRQVSLAVRYVATLRAR